MCVLDANSQYVEKINPAPELGSSPSAGFQYVALGALGPPLQNKPSVKITASGEGVLFVLSLNSGDDTMGVITTGSAV